MIVARAVQGFVGGAMIPTVFATGYALFTGKQRALIPAILGLLSSLAPTIGPTLGGWLTDTLSWHWLFFVNVVPGLIITFTIPFFESIDEPDLSMLRRFDVIGVILLAISLASLEYVLEEGYRWNWLDDPTIRNLSWTAAITGALFVWRSARPSQPDRRSAHSEKPHLRGRIALHFHHRLRTLRCGLCAAALPRPRGRLRRAPDRRCRVRCRSIANPDRTGGGQALPETRHARDDRGRLHPLCAESLAEYRRHFPMDWR